MRLTKKQSYHPDVLSDFCRDLGSLMRRGHSLGECFAAMAGGASSPAEERLYLKLLASVRQGTLADAMEDAEAFPDDMLDIIRRAESASRTEEALGMLATYYEREHTVTQSLRGHAIYPALMAALAAGILIVAGGFVLPVFADQFAALGLSFSPFARWAMSAGRWLSSIAGVALVTAVFLSVLFWLTLQNSNLGAFQNTQIARRIAAGRFVAALALFCRTGLDDEHALARSAALNEHPEVCRAVERMQEGLSQGQNLPLALASSGLASGATLDRLRTEGRTEFLLDEAAARLSADNAARLERLLVHLEPVLVLMLSVSAGAIMLSVLLPLLGGLAAMG